MDELVQGWTDPINHILKADKVIVNLTGMTVALLLYDKLDALVAFTGTVSVPDAAGGKVRFSPAANDFLAASSPYKMRWKVTDGAGKISFFPNQTAYPWIVRLP